MIELQMTHAERSKVRAAYNRAERLAERKKVMQARADHLDGLRSVGCLTRVADEDNQRASASTCPQPQVQTQEIPKYPGKERILRVLNWGDFFCPVARNATVQRT